MGSVQTTAAIGGIASALGVVIVQTFSLWHIVIPADYGLAVTALLMPIIHAAAAKFGTTDPTTDPTAVTPVTPQTIGHA